jgi:hypothetical protein
MRMSLLLSFQNSLYLLVDVLTRLDLKDVIQDEKACENWEGRRAEDKQNSMV